MEYVVLFTNVFIMEKNIRDCINPMVNAVAEQASCFLVGSWILKIEELKCPMILQYFA
jgi:hypothetical protein